MLLLNPGSAALEESLEEILDKNGIVSGPITSTDPTLNQLIALVEKIYQSERSLSGRLHIYNLFNLQNTSPSQSINQFEELIRSGQYNILESVASSKELQRNPWILLGCGANDKQNRTYLLETKNKWLKKYINQAS